MDELARTLMTTSCLDCASLPKVAEAGRIIASPGGEAQVMHNGIKVVAGGYNGRWMAHTIRALRGHHEPQEELLFHHLVDRCRNGTLIVELGCFWAYYSMWYVAAVPNSRALCLEPNPDNLKLGQRNAVLNELTDRMQFVQGSVGVWSPPAGREPVSIPTYDFDGIVGLASGQFIEMLHMDVQGAEYDVISSMRGRDPQHKVRFLVVSTHHSSMSGRLDVHGDCLDVLRSLGAHVLEQHSVQESFSGDGLIVASFNPTDVLFPLPAISRNVAERSLFPTR